MGADAAIGAVGLSVGASRTTPGEVRAVGRGGLLAAVLALMGFLGLWLMTRWGIGTSPDSIGYLQAARSIVSTAGGVLVHAEGPGATALTHFAPLYSLLLSLGGLFGLDPYDWARWLNATLFAANLLVIGLLLRDVLGGAVWLRITGTLWMLVSLPSLVVHVAMLSEAAFLFLTFLGFWALSRYLESPAPRHLVAAALCIGAAWLTRYAGVVSVVTGAIALLAFGRQPLRRRIVATVWFGIVASAGMLAWMARNVVLSSSATGREFVFHPLERAQLWQALYTVSGWLMIPQTAPDPVRFAAVGGLAIGAVAALLTLRSAEGSRGTTAAGAGIAVPALIRVLALFAVGYAGFLGFSISFFDANTPLDDRILSPVYVAGIVLSLWLVQQGLRVLRRRRPVLAHGLIAGLAVFTVAQTVQGTRLIAASHARGWGFSATAWRESPTLERVRGLDETVRIFSNIPELVYLHSGRQATAVPRPWSPMNRQPNGQYGAQMAALRQTLAAEPSVIVYFTNLRRGPRAGTERELIADLQLRVRDQLPDGLLLCAAACPE